MMLGILCRYRRAALLLLATAALLWSGQAGAAAPTNVGAIGSETSSTLKRTLLPITGRFEAPAGFAARAAGSAPDRFTASAGLPSLSLDAEQSSCASEWNLICSSRPGGLAMSTEASSAHRVNSGIPGDTKRQSVLYKVTRAGGTVYLFGTIHVGARSLYPLAPQVIKALGEAREIVLELDTRAGESFARAVDAHGRYGPGEHIRNFIAPETMSRLTAVLHARGITVASMAHLKPWLIANILMGLELHTSGYERALGNESILLEHAQAHGTAVTHLESADYQLALFDTLSPTMAERYLAESLAELSDGTSLRKARATIDAWASGRASELEALIPAAAEGDSAMASFTRQVLLGRRNPEMAARIGTIMRDGHTAFVGVGLLHLLGADGLPRLLLQRGYQVERVY